MLKSKLGLKTAILDDVQGFCFDCNKQTDIEYDDEYVEEKV